jgi:hypothetical protein
MMVIIVIQNKPTDDQTAASRIKLATEPDRRIARRITKAIPVRITQELTAKDTQSSVSWAKEWMRDHSIDLSPSRANRMPY